MNYFFVDLFFSDDYSKIVVHNNFAPEGENFLVTSIDRRVQKCVFFFFLAISIERNTLEVDIAR